MRNRDTLDPSSDRLLSTPEIQAGTGGRLQEKHTLIAAAANGHTAPERSIATDYPQYKIRCNVLCPGTDRTPSLENRVAALGGAPEANQRAFNERQPLGRLGEASEIAALVLHLASEESAFTTGSAFVIDGGWSNKWCTTVGLFHWNSRSDHCRTRSARGGAGLPC